MYKGSVYCKLRTESETCPLSLKGSKATRQAPNAYIRRRNNDPSLSKFNILTFWRRNFFLILGHPVYKMLIIQEPNKLELWNKLHFEEKKRESIHHV